MVSSWRCETVLSWIEFVLGPSLSVSEWSGVGQWFAPLLGLVSVLAYCHCLVAVAGDLKWVNLSVTESNEPPDRGRACSRLYWFDPL